MAEHHGFRAPFVAQGADRKAQIGAVLAHLHRAAALVADELHRTIRRDHACDIFAEVLLDGLGVLVLHEAERNLRTRLRRDHGLGAGSGIAAPDAVAIAGRARLDLLDQRPAPLAGGEFQADRAEEIRLREAERLPRGLAVVARLVNTLIEMGDGHPSLGIMHGGDDARQDVDGVLRRATEMAGMQVAIGSPHDDFLVEKPPQRRGDLRPAAIPHAGIADKADIRLELRRILLEEFRQVDGTILLLALDHHRERYRQVARLGDDGAARLEEGHDLALVIRGATRADRRPAG